MSTANSTDARRRALRHYLVGLGAVVGAAGITHATGSMWPLALAGAASLMLTAVLVCRLLRPARGGGRQ